MLLDREQKNKVNYTEDIGVTEKMSEYFDKMAPGEFNEKAVEYAKEHPFEGSAQKL